MNLRIVYWRYPLEFIDLPTLYKIMISRSNMGATGCTTAADITYTYEVNGFEGVQTYIFPF